MAEGYQPEGYDADGYQPDGFQPPAPGPGPTPDPCRVIFSATEFKLKFPPFVTVADGLLDSDFDVATLFLTNSCCSVVRSLEKRKKLLYLLTAHVAELLQGANGKPPSGVVGRVASATQGSVTVSVQYASQMSMTEAYFAQTQYGVMFWQATAKYRTMRYAAPANYCFPGRSPWMR